MYAAAVEHEAVAGNNSQQAPHMNASTFTAGAAGAPVPTGGAANNPHTSFKYFRGQSLYKGSNIYLSTAFCQGLQSGTKLQLHVSVHDADWDPDQYMADLAAAAAQAAAQGQQGGPANATEVRSTAKALYDCQAVVAVYRQGNTRMHYTTQLQHDGQLEAYLGCSPPYVVVLQEKVRQLQAEHRFS